MGSLNQQVGRRGEQLAAEWYAARGYCVVDRNWRCRDGEVDLVLTGPGLVVFAEVKTRSSYRFGSPLEAVSPTKAARMRRVAMAWLRAHPGHRGRVRLDVVGVVGAAIDIVEDAV